MKRITSILLLGLLLFNWCGYRWVIVLMQQTADTRLEAKLDRNEYDESQLIEIQVPVSMPYQTEHSNFERCDGEIEVNGIHYKFVRRKVQDGLLLLKCIPNQTRERLESIKNDLFKLTSDLQQDKDSKKPGDPHSTLKKNPVSDYINVQQLHSSILHAFLLTRSYLLYQPELLIELHRSTPEQPPERNSFC